MRLIVERNALFAALTRTAGVVGRRSTIEILKHVRIETFATHVSLTCTNLDIQATINVPARIETPGSTTVAAERLREICARLPEGAEIVIDATDPLRAEVRAGRSKLKIGALSADAFPLLLAPEGGTTLEAPAGALLRILTIGSASMGDAQPLDCCLLECRGDTIRTVSTDRGVLTLCDMPAPKGFDLKGQTMLNPDTVAVLIRALSGMGADDTATLTLYPGKMLGAEIGGMSVLSRVVDGEYPPYERVIPDATATPFTVDTDTFRAMIGRAKIASRNVNIDLTEGAMEILAHDQASGDSSEEGIESDWSGPDRRICVSADKLLGVLDFIRTENAVMTGALGMRPMLITETRESDWLGVVMPMVGSK